MIYAVRSDGLLLVDGRPVEYVALA